MTDRKRSVDLPDELFDKLNDVRTPGEDVDDTVERLLRDRLDRASPVGTPFALITIGVAVLWLLTFVLVDETISSVVGGVYIASVMFWTIWQQILGA